MSPVDQRIGRRIRGKRIALDFSQDRVAHAIGVEGNTIEAYERAATRVPPDHLARLAKLFDVTLSYFMT
jgi:transcriptional regulator with XRE-family HTH domain